MWLHRNNKAAKKSKGKAKAKKGTNAGQSCANLPGAAAKRARPATRSATNQSRKRAKTAPKAKRTAAKTPKNSSKGRTSVQRDAGWADAVKEDPDNPTLTAAELEEEMLRRDALHVMEGPGIDESSSGESVEWPSLTLPTRNRGRRKAPAAEPQARKRAEPKSQKRAESQEACRSQQRGGAWPTAATRFIQGDTHIMRGLRGLLASAHVRRLRAQLPYLSLACAHALDVHAHLLPAAN